MSERPDLLEEMQAQTPKTSTVEDLLDNSGSISREQMRQKVDKEYKSYQAKTLSQVEKDYLKEIKSIENLAKEGGKS